MQQFYSNGKLLLTGEYVVLDGALALAIPTSYGQMLEVAASEGKGLQWESYDHNGDCWFEGAFQVMDSGIQCDKHDPISSNLKELLNAAIRMNPGFLKRIVGCRAKTTLNFPNEWGLGTSSTLVNNIAQWAGVDPFELLWASFGGSGYDIAAAGHDSPILYSVTNDVPKITPVQINWPFSDNLFFVHLNKKQDSREGIAMYKNAEKDASAIARISKLSMELLSCEYLTEFKNLAELHESILSNLLDIPRIKDRLFPDFKGLVKSLGAWGGDFVLVSGQKSDMRYFEDKGFSTCIPFSKMIK